MTFNPHRTRALGAAINSRVQARVLAAVSEAIEVTIDGTPLKLELSIRELWVRAGPTVGDIILLRAPLPLHVRELRVHASTSLASLIVTIQSTPEVQSALIDGGATTAPYRFAPGADGWKPGGSEVFAPINSESGAESEAASAPSKSAPSATAAKLERAPEAWVSTARELWHWFVLGFRHILPLGWDHLLFVTGLVFGLHSRFRRVLPALTAFTVAHTITLALGALGKLVVSPAVVEPLIALSIAAVAIENLFFESNTTRRTALAFLFGLVHGQGFASGLIALGLPRRAFLSSLFSFNLGVEAGQLVAVLAVCVALAALRKRASALGLAVRYGSMAVGIAGFGLGVWRLLA